MCSLAAGLLTAAPSNVATFPSYGRPISIEVFRPHAEGRMPAIVFLHGADGIEAHGAQYRESADKLARRGFTVFLVHYFDRTGTRWADLDTITREFIPWMKTISDAITFAESDPGVDGRRIGLLGTSLGASLALTIASQDARVGAIVDVSGMMPGPAVTLMRRMPPTLILHGEADPIIPVDEAYKLERLLQSRGTEYEAKIYPGQGHVFTQNAARDSVERTAEFFEKVLRA